MHGTAQPQLVICLLRYQTLSSLTEYQCKISAVFRKTEVCIFSAAEHYVKYVIFSIWGVQSILFHRATLTLLSKPFTKVTHSEEVAMVNRVNTLLILAILSLICFLYQVVKKMYWNIG